MKYVRFHLRLAKVAVTGAIERTILAAIVRQMIVIRVQTERKQQDKSTHRAEKRRCRAESPNFGRLRDRRRPSGRKKLVQTAVSVDLDAGWHTT